MKTYFLFLVLLVLGFVVPVQAQSPMNSCSYSYHVATATTYPTPLCTLLTPLFCNYGALVHADSMDFSGGHLSVPFCTEFGLNPLADGRIALCIGRNVPTSRMGNFLANPIGQVLILELNLSRSPDMLIGWTYNDGTVNRMDSIPAVTGILNLINGFAHFFEFKFNCGDPGLAVDPNKNRMKFYLDGVERFNMVYDIVTQLWQGNTKAKVWVSSLAGFLPINSQVVTLFTRTCATQLPLLKQQQGPDGALAGATPSDLSVEVFPNPSRAGSINLASNQVATFKVISMVGAVIAEGEIGVGTTHVATDNFAKGIYIVEFRSEGQVERRKIVLE